MPNRPATSAKALRAAAKAASALLCALCLVLAGAAALPRISDLDAYGILSGSMEPSIPVGAAVLVDGNVAANAIREGDVIAFDMGNAAHAVCAHRVASVEEDGSFKTKGDANDVEDPIPVSPDRLVGKVALSIPHAGHLLMSVQAHRGAWIASILALTVIAAALSAASNQISNRPEETGNQPRKGE